MVRFGTAFAQRVALTLALSVLTPREAIAELTEAAKSELRVVGSCPSAREVADALTPLVKPDFRFPADARPRVVDHGTRFAVSVKGQTGEYLDAERDCAERARVSAVFIALTLNPPQIQSAEGDALAVKPTPVEKTKPPPEAPRGPPLAPVATPTSGAWSRLELGARFDGTLSQGAQSTLAAGLEVRASLGAGRVGAVLGAAVLAPVIWDISGVLVQEQRFPGHLALRLRWPSPLATLALDVGVSATAFTLRAPELAGESTAARLDIGPRAALTAQFETIGGLSPYLGAHVEYFPQAYRLNADPNGQLGSTPHAWVGMNLGASLALN